MIRVAVLDDWQRVARSRADWSPLEARAEVRFFEAPFASENDVATALAPFDIILATRERTPDADLCLLEARAELLVDEGDKGQAADAFRELGAALWDMADDRSRAVAAWLRGAHCDSVHGYATLRHDLASFGDVQYAVDCLAELVERESDRVRSGVIATQATVSRDLEDLVNEGESVDSTCEYCNTTYSLSVPELELLLAPQQ